MRTGLHILGAGGHAKVIIELAYAAGLSIAGIYDDQYAERPELMGYRLTGPMAAFPDSAGTQAVIAIGGNRVRQMLAERFQQVTWATLVHPFSWVSPTAQLGAGTVIMAGAVIQTHACLGRHVIANTGCSIDHDCMLGDYVHVAPGARLAGAVKVGEGSFFGVGSSAVPGRQVGEWSVIGAGGVVTRDVPSGITAVGAPARPLSRADKDSG